MTNRESSSSDFHGRNVRNQKWLRLDYFAVGFFIEFVFLFFIFVFGFFVLHTLKLPWLLNLNYGKHLQLHEKHCSFHDVVLPF